MLDSWKKIIGNAWRGSTAHCSFPATGNEDYNHSPIIQVKVCFLQKCMKQSVRELGGIYNGIYNNSHLHSYSNNNLHFYLNRSDCQAINSGDWHCWRPILSVEAAKPRTLTRRKDWGLVRTDKFMKVCLTLQGQTHVEGGGGGEFLQC